MHMSVSTPRAHFALRVPPSHLSHPSAYNIRPAAYNIHHVMPITSNAIPITSTPMSMTSVRLCRACPRPSGVPWIASRGGRGASHTKIPPP
eukprot:9481389-Pyramimonas_sp.AAC.1